MKYLAAFILSTFLSLAHAMTWDEFQNKHPGGELVGMLPCTLEDPEKVYICLDFVLDGRYHRAVLEEATRKSQVLELITDITPQGPGDRMDPEDFSNGIEIFPEQLGTTG